MNIRDKFPDCSVVISLTQDRSRKEEHNIGFRVYKLSQEKSQEPLFLLEPNFINHVGNLVQKTETFVNAREVRR